MPIRIVRLGTDRAAGEGLRLGTVRRPPRGVPRNEFATRNWYDVWLPELAPSVETMKLGQAAASEVAWALFTRRYRREMAEPAAAHTIDLLAALSHQTSLSVGCYCAEPRRCHRSILGSLLAERGATLVD